MPPPVTHYPCQSSSLPRCTNKRRFFASREVDCSVVTAPFSCRLVVTAATASPIFTWHVTSTSITPSWRRPLSQRGTDFLPRPTLPSLPAILPLSVCRADPLTARAFCRSTCFSPIPAYLRRTRCRGSAPFPQDAIFCKYHISLSSSRCYLVKAIFWSSSAQFIRFYMNRENHRALTFTRNRSYKRTFRFFLRVFLPLNTVNLLKPYGIWRPINAKN